MQLQDRARGGPGDQDDGHPRRAGDRRGGGDGPRARDEEEQGHGHVEVRGRVPEDVRPDGGHAADRGQPVLGDRPDEAVLRGGRAGGRVGGRDQGQARRARRAASTTRTSRAAARSAGIGGALVPQTARASSRTATPARWPPPATARRSGVIRGAVEQGKQVTVFADETRPFLQGARLTAWELVRDGIDTTVITDNMAGTFMRQGLIDLVVVGADRIAANGDVANKIGTYARGRARARARHPVLRRGAAARRSTSRRPTASRIPIEERAGPRGDARRARRASRRSGAKVRNPAFDVTPQPLRHGHHHRAGSVEGAVRGVSRTR